MMRKVLSMAALLLSTVLSFAQMPQLTPMPLDPKVKTGVLPNGLTYYVLHNEEPKNRANFYIAQKVGSTLETPEQLGLAHFLEHMCFNGTKNYPGKNMLNYLQSKGIRFGADINAATGFDETIYNIDNVNTQDKALMDSVLLVLRDWSCDVLLEDSEIEAERGVIQEEWRSTTDANRRMYAEILPKIFDEYQYHQMPIGKMEVVMNFKPEVLREYYHRWYRPDQQGIIVVGDFDADEMEQKIKDMFSTIEMPKNAPKREYPQVSENKNLIFATYTDPEFQTPRMNVSFKMEPLPREMRNTVEMYLQGPVLEKLISMMINNRLSEAAEKPECNFAVAACYFSEFYVAKTMDAFNVIIIPKTDMTAAFNEAMGIVARACKTGFTDSEYDRVCKEWLSSLEAQYNERDKTRSGRLAQELINNFTDNEPAPGIEAKYELLKMVLPTIPVDAINQMCQMAMLPSDNQVVVYTQPSQMGAVTLTEQVMGQMLKDVLNAKYEPYVDEVITEPLISQLPKPGKITSRSENALLGTTEFTLSNGVKVVVKPTDFSNDEISMTAWREGGKRTYAESEAPNVLLMDDAFTLSNWGPFNSTRLRKFLTGKRAGLSYSMNNYTNTLDGYSVVKDLPVLMQLIYTAFTSLTPDPETYGAQMATARTMLENQANNPELIFANAYTNTRYGNNPLMANVDVATIDANDYNKTLDMVKATLANAAEYTFAFTGNVDLAEFVPLMEQYIASLPVARRKKVKDLSSVSQVKGIVDNIFKQPMAIPSTNIIDFYSGYNVPFSVRNTQMISMIGEMLMMKYTETLREEEGGTYSPYAGASYNPNDGCWTITYVFPTNAEQQQKMMERAHAELLDMLQNGGSEEHFNKVKEAAINQFELQQRKNGYWEGQIMSYYRGFDYVTGAEESLKSITYDDIKTFMRGLYDGKNRIQVVMEGVAME